MLEFCSHGTLESNLREDKKSEQMFMKKNKINLANEIAKGMRHLADTRVRECCIFLMPDRRASFKNLSMEGSSREKDQTRRW